jgi:hypothetical protein
MSALFVPLLIRETKEQLNWFNIRERVMFLRTFGRSLRNFLGQFFTNILIRLLRQKSSSKECQVFDVVNAGPLHRFTIAGKKPLLVHNSIQGGSHYLFMVMTKILCDTFKEHSIDYRPYVWDIHDCVMFTVPEEQASRAKELADGLVLARFNDAIRGSVTLRADANVVDNWWDDKRE